MNKIFMFSKKELEMLISEKVLPFSQEELNKVYKNGGGLVGYYSGAQIYMTDKLITEIC